MTHPDGWRVGDRVEIGSVWAIRPWGGGRPLRYRKGRRATGHIEAISGDDIAVRFDCGLVNGGTWCTASPSELTRIEDGP